MSPAPTVALLVRSIRMKPPRSGLASYGSNAIGRSRLTIADGDLVELEHLGGDVLERVHVHLIFDVGDGGADGVGAELEPIGAPGQQRLVGHPDQGGLELVGDLRRIVGGGDDIAARAIDFVAERQRNGLAGDRFGKIAVLGDDARHAAELAGGGDANLVAGPHGAGWRSGRRNRGNPGWAGSPIAPACGTARARAARHRSRRVSR